MLIAITASKSKDINGNTSIIIRSTWGMTKHQCYASWDFYGNCNAAIWEHVQRKGKVASYITHGVDHKENLVFIVEEY